jgi:TctA family transporter
LILQGIRPGPNVMVEQPRLFWGVIASMWIGNLFLLVLNLPLIGLWVRLLAVPYQLLYPIILVFSAIGVLSLSNAPIDAHLMALFGVLGYIFAKLDCEPAPLLLGYILGPLMEEYLRRAMTLSRGDPMIFLDLGEHPISAAMLLLATLAMIAVVLPALRATRHKTFAE